MNLGNNVSHINVTIQDSSGTSAASTSGLDQTSVEARLQPLTKQKFMENLGTYISAFAKGFSSKGQNITTDKIKIASIKEIIVNTTRRAGTTTAVDVEMAVFSSDGYVVFSTPSHTTNQKTNASCAISTVTNRTGMKLAHICILTRQYMCKQRLCQECSRNRRSQYN